MTTQTDDDEALGRSEGDGRMRSTRGGTTMR